MPSVLPAPTIVFDLDGTLVDTAPDLIDTLNFVLAKDGLPPVPYATARMLIGGGAKPMIARGLEAEGRTASPETIDRMFKDFIAYYGEHIADRSRPFPDSKRRSIILRGADSYWRFAPTNSKISRCSC